MVTFAALERAAASAEVVLMGEQHDNADHHRLQAELLAAIVESGRRPAVAFEQLDFEDQDAVDRMLAASRGTPPPVRAAALAEAVAWNESGWPPFDLYRPVFEVALANDLPIRAANLSRRQMHALFAKPDTDDSTLVPLPPDALAAMAADIEQSHCGHANAQMVSMMTSAQRRRDARMAGAVLAAFAAAGSDVPTRSGEPRPGAVLVCGFGHARKDYGVPVTLAHAAPQRRIVSIGFVEVLPSVDDSAGYAEGMHAGSLPFDYVVFTPRVDSDDPCEKYRKSLEKLGRPRNTRPAG